MIPLRNKRESSSFKIKNFLRGLRIRFLFDFDDERYYYDYECALVSASLRKNWATYGSDSTAEFYITKMGENGEERTPYSIDLRKTRETAHVIAAMQAAVGEEDHCGFHYERQSEKFIIDMQKNCHVTFGPVLSRILDLKRRRGVMTVRGFF